MSNAYLTGDTNKGVATSDVATVGTEPDKSPEIGSINKVLMNRSMYGSVSNLFCLLTLVAGLGIPIGGQYVIGLRWSMFVMLLIVAVPAPLAIYYILRTLLYSEGDEHKSEEDED